MLLYINANSNPDDTSTTSRIANEFISEYQEHNRDEVKRVDLIDYKLPELDKLIMGSDDSAETKLKLEKRAEALEDFMRADKIVIAAPNWNYFYPAVLKTWIDAVVVSRKTFMYTEDGPVGLLTGKKVLFIQSSGSDYSKTPELNFGLNHLKHIMAFMGITDFTTILAYGTARRRLEVQQEKVFEAVELAKTF